MSEEQIIEHCAPTLAGIKTANLFSVRLEEGTDIIKEVRRLNEMLRAKGLRVLPLKKTDRYALIYIYRPDHLKKDLNDPRARHILKNKGYQYDHEEPEQCIVQLVRHLGNDEAFPHEIGLFLGYPPADVEGFIRDPNRGVKCCGCWKAYSEPEKAEKVFRKYTKCTQRYRELNKKGKSLAELAVNTAKNSREKISSNGGVYHE
ncbi:MAG: DUF3793 family protein [Lachnospiraceae bacterium]|nr:DUF3793 family protein [Lachnospiraceae bacterium]